MVSTQRAEKILKKWQERLSIPRTAEAVLFPRAAFCIGATMPPTLCDGDCYVDTAAPEPTVLLVQADGQGKLCGFTSYTILREELDAQYDVMPVRGGVVWRQFVPATGETLRLAHLSEVKLQPDTLRMLLEGVMKFAG